MEYWIDGYNVIGRKQWTAGMTLAQAREKLLRALLPLAVPVRVFFDASKPGASASGAASSPDPRIRPIFVREGSADDAMIEALRTSRPSGVTLVTDDRELRGRAKQLGAVTLGVDKFLEKLDVKNAPPPPPTVSRPAPPSEPGEKPDRVSRRDVDDWMKYFGFTDDASLLPPDDSRP